MVPLEVHFAVLYAKVSYMHFLVICCPPVVRSGIDAWSGFNLSLMLVTAAMHWFVALSIICH